VKTTCRQSCFIKAIRKGPTSIRGSSIYLDNKFLVCVCDGIQVLSSRACGSESAPHSSITYDINRGVALMLRTAVTQDDVLLVAPIQAASSRSIR
jgi:hypothetical protein